MCALHGYHLWWGVASSFLWLVFLSHAAAIVQLATHRAWSEQGPDVIMSPFFVFRCVVQHPDQVEDCPACRMAKYIVFSSYWQFVHVSHSCSSFGCHITTYPKATTLIINPLHLSQHFTCSRLLVLAVQERAVGGESHLGIKGKIFTMKM